MLGMYCDSGSCLISNERINQVFFDLFTFRRHSSYAVVTSKSYNPFLNLEHSINREQGVLAYLPVNSEILFNLANMSIWFSLYRPNNLVSGVSLKSRTLTITTGRILRSSDFVYNELIISEGDPQLVVRVFQLSVICFLTFHFLRPVNWSTMKLRTWD